MMEITSAVVMQHATNAVLCMRIHAVMHSVTYMGTTCSRNAPFAKAILERVLPGSHNQHSI